MEWDRDQDLPGPLDWSSRYEVGVAQLDANHRELVRLINDVRLINEGRDALGNGNRSRLVQVVDAICALASEHCGHEKEHARRLGQLERLRGQIAAETAGLDPRSVCTAPMDWFIRQAIGQDAKIKAHFGRRVWE